MADITSLHPLPKGVSTEQWLFDIESEPDYPFQRRTLLRVLKPYSDGLVRSLRESRRARKLLPETAFPYNYQMEQGSYIGAYGRDDRRNWRPHFLGHGRSPPLRPSRSEKQARKASLR